MGAGADWKRVRRLGRYLARDRRRLFVTLALLDAEPSAMYE